MFNDLDLGLERQTPALGAFNCTFEIIFPELIFCGYTHGLPRGLDQTVSCLEQYVAWRPQVAHRCFRWSDAAATLFCDGLKQAASSGHHAALGHLPGSSSWDVHTCSLVALLFRPLGCPSNPQFTQFCLWFFSLGFVSVYCHGHLLLIVIQKESGRTSTCKNANIKTFCIHVACKPPNLYPSIWSMPTDIMFISI